MIYPLYYYKKSMPPNTQSELECLLYTICYHGAPMITGLKPASLICFKNSKSNALRESWYKHREVIKKMLPFEHIELNTCTKGVNVLFYRRTSLLKVVREDETQTFLNKMGYDVSSSLEVLLQELSRRFQVHCPHEVGIFLGYPLSDVIAFSEKKSPCLLTGYWKVYSNEVLAKEIFNLYDQAKVHINSILSTGVKPSQFLNYA